MPRSALGGEPHFQNRWRDHDEDPVNMHVMVRIAPGAAGWTVPAPVSAAAPQVRLQAPDFYRMVLGDFEITALLDGTHPFPAAEVLTKARADKSAGRSKLFTDDPEQANALLSASDLKAPTEGSINAFLINTGSKLVLIDSGAGTLYGSCCGHLIENLRASGYQPEQVDEVLLTHLHADHVGGIAPGGIAAFRMPSSGRANSTPITG